MALSKTISAASPQSRNLEKAVVEIGASGTLSAAAAQLAAVGVGEVIVASVGVSAITVSLPAVTAVVAAGYLGVSVGSKLVQAINNS
ncbi:MAG: hypothetical protein F6K41_32910 [Symploca sp. SIO3E6]|nr:hypothetical protein [Caldora sp. SIO3E6]